MSSRRHTRQVPKSFIARSQVGARIRAYRFNAKKENEMNDRTKERNRKLAMLGGLGLGLAILGRKRRWRRYATGQMMGGGYAGGPWGRFGGYGHGGHGGPEQPMSLPPCEPPRPNTRISWCSTWGCPDWMVSM